MLAVGYSARETADVVSGRIGRSNLDMAQRMLAAGLGREVAADYLDSQYARVSALREQQNAPPVMVQRASFGPFDDLIERYARMHAVESALVRAIIQVESAFNPMARPHAGAIGLMQLMPGTARELGVNPLVPAQNIEGGVRYFSQLLKKFGAVDLALVAYNAGPGFAERYLRGQAALYGETREYVKNVLARFSRLR
jgi:soluble lytic murein transglycosylase-like protein